MPPCKTPSTLFVSGMWPCFSVSWTPPKRSLLGSLHVSSTIDNDAKFRVEFVELSRATDHLWPVFFLTSPNHLSWYTAALRTSTCCQLKDFLPPQRKGLVQYISLLSGLNLEKISKWDFPRDKENCPLWRSVSIKRVNVKRGSTVLSVAYWEGRDEKRAPLKTLAWEAILSGAPNVTFLEKAVRETIWDPEFWEHVVKFLACLSLLGFSKSKKWYNCPFLTVFTL